MRRAFMSTPEQLASLEGQQYLVLRPAGAVAAVYADTQSSLLAGQGRGLPHPHTGHVTLRGFFEPERHDELAALIRAWGADQHPIELVAEAVDAFHAPWQIVILRLARTAPLLHAYRSLTEALERTDLRRLGELSLDDWTFHLSVLYAGVLSAASWDELESAATRRLDPAPSETVVDAELVWYEDGEEHAELIRLGG